jgi:hypothetical protein
MLAATRACPAKVGTGFAKKDMLNKNIEQDDDRRKIILLYARAARA